MRLKRYEAAQRAAKAADKRVTGARAALAVNCQHEMTRESWDEGDNGWAAVEELLTVLFLRT